jgi:hypothetical protein
MTPLLPAAPAWLGEEGRTKGLRYENRVDAAFPSHPPALAREIVGASHGNVARVKELVAGRPALARAAWDWGYGDWETALGAASHVGHREIAELLLANGAHPTIFSAAMLGQLEVVKAFITGPALRRRVARTGSRSSATRKPAGHRQPPSSPTSSRSGTPIRVTRTSPSIRPTSPARTSSATARTTGSW